MIVLFRFKFWRRKKLKELFWRKWNKGWHQLWRIWFAFGGRGLDMKKAILFLERIVFRRCLHAWEDRVQKGISSTNHIVLFDHVIDCQPMGSRLASRMWGRRLQYIRMQAIAFALLQTLRSPLPVCRTSHTWRDSAFFFAHHPRSKTALSPSFFYSSIISIQLSTGYFSFLFSPKAVILTKTFFRFIVKKRRLAFLLLLVVYVNLS